MSVAVKLEPCFAQEARRRQLSAIGQSSVCPVPGKREQQGRALEIAAKQLGVSKESEVRP